MESVHRFILTLAILTLTGVAICQEQDGQRIKGVVVDADSGYPLTGVTVQWLVTDTVIGTTTEVDGQFTLPGIRLGRQSFLFKYIGYKSFILENIVVTRGKEIDVSIQMQEEITDLTEVVVKANASGGSRNEMITLSSNLLRVEEIKKYAGTMGDVARMAQYHAGVSGASDDRNDIIVRGNSPATVLWRLEGLDIPSPNHWATLGTSGGPISMLNTNNLQTSDFLTGAFPAEYGNATGAVFDLKLRNGNPDKFEFLGQVGFNGFEGGIEGPIRGLGEESSFFVNYRYSTLGVVNALGIDFGTGFAVPQYQDLNFKVNIPTKRMGRFSFWGLGGSSEIFFEADDEGGNLYSAGDENLRSGTTTGMLGFNHLYFFDDKRSSSLSILFSGSRNETDQEEILDAGTQTFEDVFISSNIAEKYIVNWIYNQKFNAKHRLKAGVSVDIYSFDVTDSILIDQEFWFKELDFQGSTSLLRSFAQWKWRPHRDWSIQMGMNAQLFTLNQSMVIEPRVGVNYQLSEKSKLSLGLGRHSQIHPLPIYFSKDNEATVEANQKNEELDFMKSNHIGLAFQHNLETHHSLKVELYYQQLFSIGTDPENRDFSLINTGADFGFPNRVGLENLGTGDNYGIELTLNRSFDRGYYYLLTTSLFNSTYDGQNDVKRNTYYNSNYIFNLIGGKEVRLNNRWTLLFDGRFTYAGGRRYTPIDLDASIAEGRTVLFEDQIYGARLAPYIRPDLKIGVRINTTKATHSFSVDFQNFIGRENELDKFYSKSAQRIRTERQRGFFPDVRYQVLF